MVRLWAALAAAAMVTAGCGGDAGSEADGRYLLDLQKRGVPTDTLSGAPAELGHAICSDLDDGATARGKLLQVANLQQGNANQFTMPQAEVIVFWSVSELCPQHVGEIDAAWRDATS